MKWNVRVGYCDDVAVFDLRGSAGDMRTVLVNCGFEMPGDPFTMSKSDRARVFRTGRRQCILFAELDHESDLDRILQHQCEGIFVQATCVSDFYRGIHVAGHDADEVLAQMTPLNLHELGEGCASFTEIFGLKGLIIRQAVDRYEIFFDRSYAHYMLTRTQLCALHQ